MLLSVKKLRLFGTGTSRHEIAVADLRDNGPLHLNLRTSYSSNVLLPLPMWEWR